MTVFHICLYIFLSLAFVFFLGGYIIFLFVSRRRSERPDTFEDMFFKIKTSDQTRERLRRDYDWFNNSPRENITISSHDNLELFATLIRAKEAIAPKGVIILLHGYRSSARRDLCLQMRILHDEGYHLIVAHQRAHGKSEGKYICYGVNERYDAMLWRQKAALIFGDDMPVALMGLSMGGATVLMASELADKNDTALRCIVADCPFSSPWDIVSEVIWNKYRLYPKPILHVVNLWCRLIAKFDLRGASAPKSVAASHLPVLILHGDNDLFVPHSHSKRVSAAAAKNTKLVLISKADHAQAIFYDENLYKKELLSFLEKYM